MLPGSGIRERGFAHSYTNKGSVLLLSAVASKYGVNPGVASHASGLAGRYPGATHLEKCCVSGLGGISRSAEYHPKTAGRRGEKAENPGLDRIER